MTRPNVIVIAAYLAVAGALVASCANFGITNTIVGTLLASAIVAWSRSS